MYTHILSFKNGGSAYEYIWFFQKESGYKDRNYYGISQNSKLLIAKEEELFDYKNGDRIDLDGVYYDVSKVDKVMGMSKILLERIE